MDRRDFVKGAGAFAAAGLGMSGLSESVGETKLRERAIADYKAGRYLTTEQYLAELRAQASKPYDPVAVLEAMRERFSDNVELAVCGLGYRPLWWDQGLERGGGIENLSLTRSDPAYFPDFPSAVLWLHQQAAAADAEFAAKWPVPE